MKKEPGTLRIVMILMISLLSSLVFSSQSLAQSTAFQTQNQPAAVHQLLSFPLAPDEYPIAYDQSVSTSEDSALAITLTAVDADEDPLTWAVLTQPVNGTLTGTAPNLTYTPKPNFFGSDSFKFNVNDGTNDSNEATVSITVNPINDPPVAVADTYTTDMDVVLIIPAGTGVLANDSDIDSVNLTAILVANATHGVLNLKSDGSFVYKPDSSYIGTDTFTYRALDGMYQSPVVTVIITIYALTNHPPIGVMDAYSVEFNTTLSVDALSGVLVNDSDPDGDVITAVLLGDASFGSLDLQRDGSFTYTPDTGYIGADHFTYEVSDGRSTSNPVMVTIYVNSSDNAAPVAKPDYYETILETTLTVDAASGVLANDNDADGDSLSAVLLATTTQGSLTLNSDGSFTYIPKNDYTGPDHFTYEASDGLTLSNVAMVMIAVNPEPNTAPVAAADAYKAQAGTALVVDVLSGVLVNDTDADGDVLSAILVTDALNGSAILAVDGSFTYHPVAGFTGLDSFSYKANDGIADSATVSVTILVVPLETYLPLVMKIAIE